MIGKARYVIACSMILVCVGTVNASPAIMWEDFEDENGNGAFDPAFIHTIGPYTGDPTAHFYWYLANHDYNPHPPVLQLVPASDYITFVLAEGQYVSYASATMDYTAEGKISFFGTTGVITYDSYSHGPGWHTYDADISQIGEIYAIQLDSAKGLFDDIILTVVPEPSTWALFICGVVMVVISRKVLFGRNKKIV